MSTRGLSETVRQAERISDGEGSLHALLQVPAGGVVFTTIQKIRPARGEDEMPVLSERRNIIVMADEAHRSQYAQFAQNLVVALPHALRIGFTGTPIEKGYRSTSMTFGDYISKYTIGRSIEDGATVPIYYENRRVPIDIDDPELLTEVEEVLEEEDDTARRRLMTRWAQLAAVVGADDRLRRDPMQAQLFGDKLQSVEPDEAERDIREEMRSVRTQVAQGLPVTRRWTINADLGPVGVGSRDGSRSYGRSNAGTRHGESRSSSAVPHVGGQRSPARRGR